MTALHACSLRSLWSGDTVLVSSCIGVFSEPAAEPWQGPSRPQMRFARGVTVLLPPAGDRSPNCWLNYDSQSQEHFLFGAHLRVVGLGGVGSSSLTQRRVLSS